jgi:hypothetical protein
VKLGVLYRDEPNADDRVRRAFLEEIQRQAAKLR